MKTTEALVAAGAVLAGYELLKPKKTTSGNGSGSGSSGGSGSGSSGGANPAGILITVSQDLGQRRYRSRLGGGGRSGLLAGQSVLAGQITKVAGQNINVGVAWQPATTDYSGRYIPWNYRLEYLLGHSTTFGWKRPVELNSQWDSGDRMQVVNNVSRPSGGTRNDALPQPFKAPPDANQVWDVHVILYAQQSDANGKPAVDGNGNPVWVKLDQAKDDGAVLTVLGAAHIGGTIGTISGT